MKTEINAMLLVLLMVAFLGCGKAEYDRRFDESIRRLNSGEGTTESFDSDDERKAWARLRSGDESQERLLALSYLAKVYEKDQNEENAKQLIPMQREFLESSNATFVSHGAAVTPILKNLAEPNRDALRKAFERELAAGRVGQADWDMVEGALSQNFTDP